jgi:hypothetical protein
MNMEKEPLVLPVLGVIAAPDVSLDEVAGAAGGRLFEMGLRTKAVPFDFTDYYLREMGPGLTRVWYAGAGLVRASALADYKLAAGTLEGGWRESGARRVNLDPGYISALQLVLATTKTLPQAAYLRDGISAVVELIYKEGGFAPTPWTYPDYDIAATEKLFEPFRSRFLELQREVGK